MTTLYELAEVLRSKNAGPFVTTIDLLFGDRRTFDRVVASGTLAPRRQVDLSAEAAGRVEYQLS